MQMLKYLSLRTLHLETTTRCNARCPMCARNVRGGKVNPRLPIADLTLQDVTQFFPSSFIRQLKRVYLCGNFGDPAAGEETLEILKFFRRTQPALDLSIHSNGGVRSEAWWAEVAQVVSSARFAIDGLSETNSIYRRGTHWPRIIANLKAFIAAGGKAEWDFLVFRHNEHEIADAEKLAKELGVHRFRIKRTSRFKTTEPDNGFRVENVDGSFAYAIYSPSPIYQNASAQIAEQLAQRYGSLERYYDQAQIKCKAVAENSIFVSAEGLVFPCCWTAQKIYMDNESEENAQSQNFFLGNQPHQLSLRQFSLNEILSSPVFSERLEQSFQAKSCSSGKLKVCSRICGSELDAFSQQFAPLHRVESKELA